MNVEFKHVFSELKNETVNAKVDSFAAVRNEIINAGIENFHVSISKGNRKTSAVASVSLLPVIDCLNCQECKNGCYDIRHDLIYSNVIRSRAINSAIARRDPERYFTEIVNHIQGRKITAFRFHIGGDMLNRSYFLNVVKTAESCPICQFLVFTKLYGVVNRYLDNGGKIPANLHVIFSDWQNANFDNRYNLPVSSPVWYDKSGNEIARGSHTTDNYIWCPGNCAECAQNCGGCFGLKAGETVLFEAH